jgi:AraC-like DNA-binding protein
VQPLLPATLLRAQSRDDYVPVVGERGWEAWHEQSNWVLETDEAEPLSCQLRLGRRERPPFEWAKGTWHLFSPGTGYRFGYPLPLRAHRSLWVVFALHAPVPVLRRPLSVFSDEEGRLAGHVQRLAELQDGGAPGDQLQAQGLLLSLVGILVNAADDPERGDPGRPWTVRDRASGGPPQVPSLLQRLDAAVEADLRSPPSVGELARRLGMSPSSLAHRLRSETGWTVVARARYLRVQEAQRRLTQDPEAPVKALAHALGFSSPQYLIRVFREVTGLTPGQYGEMAAYRREG